MARSVKSKKPDSTADFGIDADIGNEHAATFRHVQHPDLRSDYIIANPPFNDSDWFRNTVEVRWTFGVLPKGNASIA